MKITNTHQLNQEQKEQVLQLWNNEYPEKLAYKNIDGFESYLEKLNEVNHFILADKEKICGWAITFKRENETWFAIILSESLHGKGWGTKVLHELKQYKKELNGWVIDNNNDRKLNGNFYKSPLEFYIKNGFEVFSDIRLELEIMSAVKIKWIK
ncbi:GNAT family N-acetyltransferase [Chryseobacterium sp. Ch-15]|uniref:GNAT family N-acetyltransferase n=1 Tax=Chryseobacterium muglaense TaxID=2893752 RepID=A0A9Q3YT26_9FLAO|nr:GNAT family N-acetyltransferase [Chryseobacterium muglaense]MBD3903191.1 GNAT family N-acetyltransferase [Chryseobacterium muglaense]MCC9036023.1 GNAT family N-acetyltransferase [Chryseobacterium muglaense]MCM2553401.1 GNAT family N-acetyltransferase [Chryseobacterium muglaense]